MTFEEFFKKKKIDLPALEKAEQALFSEFKNHFEQMGEKSFDHTKKYWFNKLRLQYPLPPEVKVEKVRIENPLAEQTIIESLLEEGTTAKPAAPKPGFTPRFKAPITPKPAEEKNVSAANTEQIETEEPAVAPPKPAGFTPRFKAATPPTKVEETVEEKPATTEQSEEPAASQAYKPRFKPGIVPKKPEE